MYIQQIVFVPNRKVGFIYQESYCQLSIRCQDELLAVCPERAEFSWPQSHPLPPGDFVSIEFQLKFQNCNLRNYSLSSKPILVQTARPGQSAKLYSEGQCQGTINFQISEEPLGLQPVVQPSRLFLYDFKIVTPVPKKEAERNMKIEVDFNKGALQVSQLLKECRGEGSFPLQQMGVEGRRFVKLQGSDGRHSGDLFFQVGSKLQAVMSRQDRQQLSCFELGSLTIQSREITELTVFMLRKNGLQIWTQRGVAELPLRKIGQQSVRSLQLIGAEGKTTGYIEVQVIKKHPQLPRLVLQKSESNSIFRDQSRTSGLTGKTMKTTIFKANTTFSKSPRFKVDREIVPGKFYLSHCSPLEKNQYRVTSLGYGVKRPFPIWEERRSRQVPPPNRYWAIPVASPSRGPTFKHTLSHEKDIFQLNRDNLIFSRAFK